MEGIAQMVESLPSKHEALSSNSNTAVEYNTWKVVGGLVSVF
jgi:hypothetical protein